MNKKRIAMKIALFMAALLGISITGCGSSDVLNSSNNVELIEPVTSTSHVETAAYRDIYNSKVYSANIYPYTEEYSYSNDIVFGHYAVYPGNSVHKNAPLVYADVSIIDEQMEGLTDKIQNSIKEYQNYKIEVQEQIVEEYTKLGSIQGQLNSVSGNDTGNVSENNPEKEAAYLLLTNQFKKQAHVIDTKKLQLEQRTQLFDMDYAHDTEQLANMEKKKNKATLTSPISGTLAAIGGYYSGDYIPLDTKIIAVVNDNQKILKCEYITKGEVASWVDVYAMVNGRRYEVTYLPYDMDEYNRLSTQGITMYSSFIVEDPNDEVKAGDYAILVGISDYRKKVLTIPKSAIHKDASGHFVYQIIDGENQYTGLKTGLSDGVYTEVLSGLSVNDTVLITDNIKYSDKTVGIEKGRVSSSYESNGFLFYPSSSYAKNPVLNGTTYFVEYHVSLYQHVEAGDVIATIKVVGDEIALYSNQLKLQRLQDRLINIQGSSNKREIEKKEEEIEKLQELVDEMNADYATTTITAQSKGIVIWLADYKSDSILEKEANIAQIATENKSYLLADNPNNLLNYGNTVTVTYQDKNDQLCQAEGRVVSLASPGLSHQLRTDYAYISLPAEAIGQMSAATQDRYGNYYNRTLFKVTADIRVMEDVLMIPKGAVREMNGCTYVYVMDDNGDVTAQSFIAGGSDTNNYWVAEGLVEGMRLCLE